MPTVPLLPAGAKPRGDDFNRLRAQLESQRVTGSAGVLASAFSGGSTLAALGLPLAIRRTAPAAPFTLYDASTTSGGTVTLKIGIVAGTVNGISPTFTGASPSGVLSDSPPPVLTITATTYFWLKCVGTFGSPDSYVVTVETSSTSTVPSGTTITGTGFTSFLSIGSVIVSGGAITSVNPVNNGASWNAESYGSTNLWWK